MFSFRMQAFEMHRAVQTRLLEGPQRLRNLPLQSTVQGWISYDFLSVCFIHLPFFSHGLFAFGASHSNDDRWNGFESDVMKSTMTECWWLTDWLIWSDQPVDCFELIDWRIVELFLLKWASLGCFLWVFFVFVGTRLHQVQGHEFTGQRQSLFVHRLNERKE